jgi:hypothetical protein
MPGLFPPVGLFRAFCNALAAPVVQCRCADLQLALKIFFSKPLDRGIYSRIIKEYLSYMYYMKSCGHIITSGRNCFL